jgi:oxygen-independent coproporphyrinogen-3 oxidase
MIGGDSVCALYVHVPFCRSKCRYCDFYSRHAQPSDVEAYLAALEREWAARRGCLGRPLKSVFVGGGTPTVLGAEGLRRLLGLFADFLGPATEFTVEANPGTVDASVAEALAAGGVNRVTLGAQSFDPAELAFLGRTHRAGQVGEAFDLLRAEGIENLGLDLIYAIPGQSPAGWRESLRRGVELAPRHVSGYALSVEEGTPLAADLRAGRFEQMSDELQRVMYYQAVDQLSAAGLKQYEISNFSAPGAACRQNLTYWRNDSYLGLGPAACSYVGGERRTNRPDLEAYGSALGEGRLPPAAGERLEGREAMAETLMLALRLRAGVDVGEFRRRFALSPQEAFGRTLRRYANLGALEVSETTVRLTREAMFTADCVLADILAEA